MHDFLELIIKALKHISMCRQCAVNVFHCIPNVFEDRAHWGTLQKAAQSPMCCKAECVIMCHNAFQCVFSPMCFNVPSMCLNVFPMCLSHIENKWSRHPPCPVTAIQVFTSAEFNCILRFCLANWYAFTTTFSH